MSVLQPSVFVIAVVLATALAGCANTVRGVATDVKETGNAVGQAVK